MFSLDILTLKKWVSPLKKWQVQLYIFLELLKHSFRQLSVQNLDWNIFWVKRAWKQVAISHKSRQIRGQNLVHLFALSKWAIASNFNKFGTGWWHNQKFAFIWYGLNKLLNKLSSIWTNRQMCVSQNYVVLTLNLLKTLHG